MELPQTLKGTAQGLAGLVRGRWRALVGTGIATVLVAVATRRHRRHAMAVTFPEPAGLAAEAAVSVHNAAKSTVIAAVREADEAGVETVRASIRRAVADAADAGVDITAVVIGGVEGAVEIAHLLEVGSDELASAAAEAAAGAASECGAIAGERVVTLLGDLLEVDGPARGAR